MIRCKRCGRLQGELNPHNGKCEPMHPMRDDNGKALGPRCPVDAECMEWRIDVCTKPDGCRLQRKTEVILCRKTLWVWLQDFLDSMATDGDRHDLVIGGRGRCYDGCPACTAAKLAKAMRDDHQ